MERKGNVLAIMSAKGGTGKTSTTANIAAALASEFDRKILAIDTNITTASLGLHFGIDYPKVTIYDVLKRDYSIESSIVNYMEKLDVIPASLKGIHIKNSESLVSFSEKIRKLVTHYDILLSTVVKKYDLVLLDAAPGFSYEAIAAMNIADGVLFITTPEYPSLLATAKAVAYSRNAKVPMGGIVLNKMTYRNYELDPKDIRNLLGAEIAREIPFDYAVPESIAKGQPVVLYKKHNPASIAYKKLAGSLVGEKYYSGVFDRLKTFLMNKVPM